MKKLILAACFFAFQNPVFAADNLGKSGFNVGINTGIMSGRTSINLEAWDWNLANEGKHKMDETSPLLGFQAGYKHFLDNGVMLGLEGDYQKANYGVGLTDTPYSDASIAQEIKEIYTLRAKIGKMINNDTLAYVTGGYAHTVGDVRLKDGDYHDFSTATDVNSQGLVIGLGLERSITENISVKGEYLHLKTTGNAHTYLDLEKESFYAKTVFGADLLKIGINYNF